MTFSGSPNPDPGIVKRDEETLQRQREEKAEQDRLEEERKILEQEVPFWKRQKQLEGDEFTPNPDEEQVGPHLPSIALETGIGVTTDIATVGLLGIPLVGQGLYYGTNFGVGYGANALAQWMRGDWDDFSHGEALSAGFYQTIPMGTTAKGLKGLRRAAVKGAVGGAGMAQLEVGIDERRRLTTQELMLSSILGGTVAGGFKSAELGGDVVDDVIRNPYSKYRPFTNRLGLTETGTVGAMKRPKSKGFADPTGEASSKFYNPETGDVLANSDPKNVELLKKIGLTDNESRFVLDNYYKIDRDTAAAIENLGSNVDEFEKTREEALPYFLKAWANVKRKRTPQLDHTTQLKAALPFFNNARVKEFPEIARIIVEEGIFSLGHSKKNLTMLDADVHQIKTNFWTRTVGPNGKKFFEGRDISTPEKLRAAAKEYAKLIKQSNNIVDNAIQQYRFMNQTDISVVEFDEFVTRLGGGRIDQKNMIKQVKEILTDMEQDGFIKSGRASEVAENKVIRKEASEAKIKAEREKVLDNHLEFALKKSDKYKEYISKQEGKFRSPYAFGMDDDLLQIRAEAIVKDMKKNRAIKENIQGTIFDKQDEEALIEKIKKLLLDQSRSK